MLIPFNIFIPSQGHFHYSGSTNGWVDILSYNSAKEKRLLKLCTLLINQTTKSDDLTSKDVPSYIMFCKIHQSDSFSDYFCFSLSSSIQSMPLGRGMVKLKNTERKY